MTQSGSNLDVSVVLPCLNERDAVGSCVKEAKTALDTAELSGEVLVVDNGSTDGSRDVAAEAGARVIAERRRGYGRALRTGFEQARGRVVVMADADGTYDLSKIPELVRPVLDDDVDMMLATRLDAANHETMPFLHRHVGTPVITFLTARAGGRKLTKDSQTGYRAFNRDRFLDLGLSTNGMELASEMLIRAARADLRIGNMDGGYRERIGDSKLNTWSDGLRHLKLIMLLSPEVFLIAPGLIIAALGVLALLLGFLQPSGVEVGSARWQPVFFSGIALVLGLQAAFAGMVVAAYSPLARTHQRAYAFLRHPLFPRRMLGAGILVAVTGLLVDVGLFVAWVQTSTPAPTGGLRFGLASLAQTLLILGGSCAVFGVLARFGSAVATQRDDARRDGPVVSPDEESHAPTADLRTVKLV